MNIYRSPSLKNITQILSNRQLNHTLNTSINFQVSKCCEGYACKNFEERTADLHTKDSALSTMCIDFSPEGDYFLSTHGDHKIRIISFPSCEVLQVLESHARTPWSAKFNPRNPALLVSGDFTGAVFLWNWREKRVLKQVYIPNTEYIFGVEFHPNKDYIIITTVSAIYGWKYMESNNAKMLYSFKNYSVKASKLYAQGKKIICCYILPNQKRNDIQRVMITSFLFDVDKEIMCNERPIMQNCSVYSDRTVAISKDSKSILLVCNEPPPSNQTPITYMNSKSSFNDDYAYNGSQTKKENGLFKNLFHIFHYNGPTSSKTIYNAPVSSLNSVRPQQRHTNNNLNSLPPSVNTLPPLNLHTDADIYSPPLGSYARQDTNTMQAIRTYKYIDCVSLDENTWGSILSSHPITDPVEIISMSYSPTEEFVLTTNQHTRRNITTIVPIPYTRIYKVSDWSVTSELYDRSLTVNTCMWSPSMLGYAYGTDSGRTSVNTFRI